MKQMQVLLAIGWLACGPATPRPPTCGFTAFVVAPTIIQETFKNVGRVILDVPIGLPPQLPIRIVGRGDQTRALIGYNEDGQLVVGHQGGGFPLSETAGYGLLISDDSTGLFPGILIYQSVRPPPDYPQLGLVTAVAGTLPLYGVRVHWLEVSNPRCPLLGDPREGQS